MKMNLQEIFETDFLKEYNNKDKDKKTKNKEKTKKKEKTKENIDNNIDQQKKVDDILYKYKRNKEVIEYLENNPKISKKAEFDIIKNMKYKELLDAYFKSFEFNKICSKPQRGNKKKDYSPGYTRRLEEVSKKYIHDFCK